MAADAELSLLAIHAYPRLDTSRGVAPQGWEAVPGLETYDSGTGFSVNAQRNLAFARVRFYFLILALALLAGCDRAPIGHWIEEVKLSDGSTLWVDQERKYRTFSELGGPGAAFDEKVTLNFKAGEQPVPEWSERLFPVLLDRDPNNGEWIVVATTTESREWRNRGKPLVPYWQFRLRGGVWREEPLSDFVWNRKVNLLVGIFNLEKNGERVSWDTKRAWRLHSTPTPRFWKIDPKGRIAEGSNFPDLTKQEMLEE